MWWCEMSDFLPGIVPKVIRRCGKPLQPKSLQMMWLELPCELLDLPWHVLKFHPVDHDERAGCVIVVFHQGCRSQLSTTRDRCVFIHLSRHVHGGVILWSAVQSLDCSRAALPNSGSLFFLCVIIPTEQGWNCLRSKTPLSRRRYYDLFFLKVATAHSGVGGGGETFSSDFNKPLGA